MKSEESIFAEASDLCAGERESFVREACGDDSALRERLRRLLAAHDSNGILDLPHSPTSCVDDQFAKEGQLIGPFRLLGKIGEGGFGVVFKAAQQHPIERVVALKVIKPGMDSKEVVARFEAERQALAMMDHPNIARVFDGGKTELDHRPYFVMELVQGDSITKFCDDRQLPIAERIELFISVCHAVHHAHQRGIIHRDIKPNNVLVAVHDGNPVVKVIDFGVAKALNHGLSGRTVLTRAGSMVGTPQYMSPEQADWSENCVDTRSDVYSLSVLLYELLVGTAPLDLKLVRNAGLSEIRDAICRHEFRKPSRRLFESGNLGADAATRRGTSVERLKKQIRGDLDWIVMKGLEKDRERRYDSAKELVNDVECFLNHQPVSAGPPSLTYRMRKFAVRNRNQLFLFATTVLVVGLTLLAYWNNLWHVRAAQQKDVARVNRSLDDATAAVIAAVNESNSQELWTAANVKVEQVEGLLMTTSIDALTSSRVENFLERFEASFRHRNFMQEMEELLVNKSTKQDLQSLQEVERQFRWILRQRGYDIDELSFGELGANLKLDKYPVQVTDAVELWLATRIKIADAGGEEMLAEELAGWTDAMCVADPDPMRTAIRKTIFRTVPASKEYLEEVVSAGDLSSTCARKLSWLSDAYRLVGDPDKSAEIRQYALMLHPGNLVLNFESAMILLDEGQIEDATRYLMRCTAIRPELPGVWKALGKAFVLCGEHAQALIALKKYQELVSNESDADSVNVLIADCKRQISTNTGN